MVGILFGQEVGCFELAKWFKIWYNLYMDIYNETQIPKEFVDDFQRVAEKAKRLFDFGLAILPVDLAKDQFGYVGYLSRIKKELENELTENLYQYAAFHKLVGSSVDWSVTMAVDTPDRLIETYMDKLLDKFEKLERGEITVEQFYE